MKRYIVSNLGNLIESVSNHVTKFNLNPSLGNCFDCLALKYIKAENIEQAIVMFIQYLYNSNENASLIFGHPQKFFEALMKTNFVDEMPRCQFLVRPTEYVIKYYSGSSKNIVTYLTQLFHDYDEESLKSNLDMWLDENQFYSVNRKYYTIEQKTILRNDGRLQYIANIPIQDYPVWEKVQIEQKVKKVEYESTCLIDTKGGTSQSDINDSELRDLKMTKWSVEFTIPKLSKKTFEAINETSLDIQVREYLENELCFEETEESPFGYSFEKLNNSSQNQFFIYWSIFGHRKGAESNYYSSGESLEKAVMESMLFAFPNFLASEKADLETLRNRFDKIKIEACIDGINKYIPVSFLHDELFDKVVELLLDKGVEISGVVKLDIEGCKRRLEDSLKEENKEELKFINKKFNEDLMDLVTNDFKKELKFKHFKKEDLGEVLFQINKSQIPFEIGFGVGLGLYQKNTDCIKISQPETRVRDNEDIELLISHLAYDCAVNYLFFQGWYKEYIPLSERIVNDTYESLYNEVKNDLPNESTHEDVKEGINKRFTDNTDGLYKAFKDGSILNKVVKQEKFLVLDSSKWKTGKDLTKIINLHLEEGWDFINATEHHLFFEKRITKTKQDEQGGI